jgi:hypothetical protein
MSTTPVIQTFTIFKTFTLEGTDERCVILVNVDPENKLVFVARQEYILQFCKEEDPLTASIPISDTGFDPHDGNLVGFGLGKLDETSCKSIRRSYLNFLYFHFLQAKSMTGNIDYSADAIMNQFQLKIIASAFTAIYDKSLVDQLKENNFQRHSATLKTKIETLGGLYRTPLTLWWYPDVNLVASRYVLCPETPDLKAGIVNKATGFELEESSMVVGIRRHYKDCGWLSLKDMMRLDTKLDYYIRDFYRSGYGSPAIDEWPKN